MPAGWENRLGTERGTNDMTTYYVSTKGSDSGNGSANSPFKTISKAMKANLKPGDEVVVKSGTYKEAVIVNKDGKSGDYITIRSEVPGGAKIVPTGDKPGVIINADYVTFDGFDVSGSKGSGIAANRVHHVEVINNIVHDNVSNGIYLGQSDFLLVEGNVVYDNSAKGSTSGIHLKGAYNVSGAKGDSGFRIIIRDNVAYGNKTEYGPRTDGNGISLDDFQNTQLKNLPPYKFKTLVEGNIVYDNSGRGVQVAWSDYATIRDNISIANNSDGRTGTWRGELVNMGSHNNTWVGNISITDAGNPAIANLTFKGDPSNKNITWHDNTTFNGRKGDDSVYANAGNSTPNASNGNKLGIDPGLTLNEIKVMAGKLGNRDLPSQKDPVDPVTEDPGVGGSGDEQGTAGNDKLVGGAGTDDLSGGAGKDMLFGGNGKDLLDGGTGDDIIVGGNGVDKMTGGDGADTFVFGHTFAAFDGDVITDFSRAEGDRIDLGGMDANTTSGGNQGFAFIGSKAFSGKAGELQYRDGKVSGDINGDGKADFHIEIANNHGLVADDFIL
jgi:Ca2+-binding RTX toxin-like protein